ncbi:hypothetical protein [Streptomyces sp. NPDC054765]
MDVGKGMGMLNRRERLTWTDHEGASAQLRPPGATTGAGRQHGGGTTAG